MIKIKDESLYTRWKMSNLRNPNIKSYHRWDSINTFVTGIYDTTTGYGVERKYVLVDEYEVDKTEELENDMLKYHN